MLFRSPRGKRPNRTRKQQPQRRATRPLLELLEDRITPSTVTFNVNSTQDSATADGSLREAILAANADSNPDTEDIKLTAGTFTLSIANSGAAGVQDGKTGNLVINPANAKNIIIEGASQTGTIIDATGLGDRVFQIEKAGVNVTFKNLTIQGGTADDDGTQGAKTGLSAAEGGAILNSGGNVTLMNVTLKNNNATSTGAFGADGGAIFSNAGSLSLQNVTATGNTASSVAKTTAGVTTPGTGSAEGGAISAIGASITLDNVSLTNNKALAGLGGTATGGGLAAEFTDVVVAPNPDGTVPANFNPGSLTAPLLTVSSNTAQGGNGADGAMPGDNGSNGGFAQGGGVFLHGGSANLLVAAISGNTAQGGNGGKGADNDAGDAGDGGNGAVGSGGGVWFDDGAKVIVTDSTIDHNNALGGNGGNGGNATAGNNEGGDGGLGNSAFGGGLTNVGSTLTMINSTVANNTGKGGAGGKGGSGTGTNFGGDGGGGGNANGGGMNLSGTTTLINDTIAYNVLTAGAGGARGQNKDTPSNAGFDGSPGTTTGGGINGFATATNTLVSNNQANTNPNAAIGGSFNFVGDNIFLGQLANNGGPTQTIAELPGSGTIGGGTNSVLALINNQDQRGVKRPASFTVDIGSFEFGVTGVTTTALPINTNFSSGTQTVTLTATVKSGTALDPVDEGTVTFVVMDSTGKQIGSTETADVDKGVASHSFNIPPSQTAGTYTVKVLYSDPGTHALFTNGTDNSASLTIAPLPPPPPPVMPQSPPPPPASPPPPPQISQQQALFQLFFDGFALEFDTLLGLTSAAASTQAQINSLLPIAGPFGSFFVLGGEQMLINSISGKK